MDALIKVMDIWSIVVNCDLINNKDSTVIKFGTCIVNVFVSYREILHC